jgi:AraC-like DNA-binding protein
MSSQPLARHLLRARDPADARYAEPLTVADMARAAGLSPAHFSREFKRSFGESPHQYLLTRRLERAATLLRVTDARLGGPRRRHHGGLELPLAGGGASRTR